MTLDCRNYIHSYGFFFCFQVAVPVVAKPEKKSGLPKLLFYHCQYISWLWQILVQFLFRLERRADADNGTFEFHSNLLISRVCCEQGREPWKRPLLPLCQRNRRPTRRLCPRRRKWNPLRRRSLLMRKRCAFVSDHYPIKALHFVGDDCVFSFPISDGSPRIPHEWYCPPSGPKASS